MLKLENTQVEIQTKTSAPAFLILSDVFYPGWQATIDNTPAQIFQTNYIQRGVKVPSGEHVVRFEFHPRSFSLGVGITVASFFGCGYWLLLRKKRASSFSWRVFMSLYQFPKLGLQNLCLQSPSSSLGEGFGERATVAAKQRIDITPVHEITEEAIFSFLMLKMTIAPLTASLSTSASRLCNSTRLALIPQPLLPNLGKEENRFQSPSPFLEYPLGYSLGEGYTTGMHPLGFLSLAK